jgi:hypothetical protein
MPYTQFEKINSHSRVQCYKCGQWAVMIEDFLKEPFYGACDQTLTHKCGNCDYRGELTMYDGVPTLVHPLQP